MLQFAIIHCTWLVSLTLELWWRYVIELHTIGATVRVVAKFNDVLSAISSTVGLHSLNSPEPFPKGLSLIDPHFWRHGRTSFCCPLMP